MSYSWIKRDAADVSKVAGTFYTYDIHGNVDTLVQDYEGIAVMATDDRDRYKRITYNYDLISGKVNGVNYQPGETDAFYHRYYYDAENRLTSVKTSRDSVIWEEDAAYEYYRHGPLLRTKLGQLNVQGLDYAYTLQGWLKGINDTAVGDGSNDMGQDGLLDRMTVARDVFGLALHYYDTIGHSDYRAIGDGVAPFAKPNNADFRSLYNGNIAGMSVNLAALGRASVGVNAEPLFYKYRYDQLNRLVSMRAYKGFNNTTNAWTPVLLDDYREEVRYDANGNILNYIRNGSPEVPDSAKLMDSLNYKYWTNTNQLKQVLDDAGYSGNYWADIDNQTETENYVYDAIGNLVQDKAENLTIAWNVYGKIDSIVKPGGTIKYTYDAAGNRISKTYDGKTTVYVRDASGNVMSIYQKDGVGTLDQSELHLYGSSRLGLTGKRTADPEAVTLATGFDPGKLITFTRGEKIFELSNHLGNILATINDKKLATDDGNGEVAYYEADVVTANDYYPFGMIMPGRKYAFDDTYRYGFNGKENDNEVKGEGGQQDYGMRIYDPRLGCWQSMDPLQAVYPFLSPYNFVSNNPLIYVDLDGKKISFAGKEDAEKFHNSVNQIFSGAKFDAFRTLLTRGKKNNKTTFDKIDENKLTEAIKDLSGREQYLARMYAEAINDSKTIKVAYYSNNDQIKDSDYELIYNKLTTNGKDGEGVKFANAFRKEGTLSKTDSKTGAQIEEKYYYFEGSFLQIRGGAFTIENGDVAMVYINPQVGDADINSGHETLGHGLPLIRGGYTKEENDDHAVRTENLIREVSGKGNQIDGTSHNERSRKTNNPSELPAKKKK